MVQAHPWLFVADGTPEGERPNAFHAIVERHEAEQAPAEHDVVLVHEPEPLEREDVRVLARAITVAVGPGQQKKLVQYEAGTVFNARSELCSALPDAFEDADSDIQFTKPRRRR